MKRNQPQTVGGMIASHHGSAVGAIVGVFAAMFLLLIVVAVVAD